MIFNKTRRIFFTIVFRFYKKFLFSSEISKFVERSRQKKEMRNGKLF